MYRRERWWAVGLSLGLHAAFLSWVCSETTPQLAANSVVYVEAVLFNETRSESHVMVGEAPNVQQVKPGIPTPPDIARAPKQQSAYIQKDKPLPMLEPIGYLPFDAVDQAAEPLGDWVIDSNVLPPGRPLRIVLKLWVSATGIIDHWTLSGVQDDDEALARQALARIPETLIQPAFLNHVAVPSFRQLEMVLVR